MWFALGFASGFIVGACYWPSIFRWMQKDDDEMQDTHLQ